AIKATVAKRPIERDEKDKGDTHRGELAKPAFIIKPVRIDERKGRRQRRFRLMVIDHDGRKSIISRNPQRLMRHGAAINRDEKIDALIFQPLERRDIRPVPLADAIRNIDTKLAPYFLEEAVKQRA